jgi:hypothetical protein
VGCRVKKDISENLRYIFKKYSLMLVHLQLGSPTILINLWVGAEKDNGIEGIHKKKNSCFLDPFSTFLKKKTRSFLVLTF